MVEKLMLMGLAALLVVGAASEVAPAVAGVFAKIEAAHCDAQNVCVTVKRDAQ